MVEPRQPAEESPLPVEDVDRAADGRWAKVAGGALIAALVIGLTGAAYLTPDCAGEECPAVESLWNYRPPEPAQIHDARGDLAGQLSGPQRIVVGMDSIPEIIRNGYVAVEDRRFWDHDGVDVRGAFRALLANVRSKGIAEGASTITMQLARNVFGSEVLDWNQFHRKLMEIRLARELESQLSKEQILELYLNQIYLGDGVYGVETAARHYLGKPVAQVSTREAALLIGLAKNPEGYNPRSDPYAANDRIETVLDLLEREAVITPEEAQEARGVRVDLSRGETARGWGKNAYFLSAVRRELRNIYPNPSDREGLRVYTGLDQRAQATATDALVEQIRAIERGRWGTFRHEAAADSLARVETSTSPFLQGMVVAMDPESGLVTTLVGGRDYAHSEFDRAFQALRQPGSAFKPIVYAAALENGLRLTDRISTDPVRLAREGMRDWEPGDHVTAPELSLRDALVFSSNTATVRVGQRLGTRRVADQAHGMGITSEIPQYPSIYLGAADVVPAQLVAAYAAFTNGGHTVEPHFITRIEDPHGHVVYRHARDRGTRALDPRIAFLVLDMMRDIVRRGTGWRVGSSGLSYPAAGKTGTTNDSRDVWFIGMTPRLVAGVWLGFDEPRTIVRGAGGGDLAAPVWATFMQVANRDLGPMPAWRPPGGVIEVSIDPRTGYRVTPDCPVHEVRTEYFLQGTEPIEHCPFRDPYGTGDAYWDSTSDSILQRYNQPGGRTIFYPGEEEEREDLEKMRERMEGERQRRLDSLDALRRQRTLIRPADTTRLRRPTDTLRVRRDTTGRDTLRRDTLRRPRRDTLG